MSAVAPPAADPAARGALLVAIASGAYAAAILALRPGYQAVADSHYHFSVARDIAHGDLVPDPARSLPWTVLHDMPVDHYWGYHLLIAPFGWIPDPVVGMKAATVAGFAAIFVSMYLFLHARGVSYAWLWALAPSIFSTQDWRYLQLRGAQLIVPLLFAMTHVAFFEPRARRRRWLLFAIGYVALLSYHGGVILLPFHVGGVLALGLVGLFGRRELAPWQLFEPAITALGMAAGLTLNPYMDARASTWRFFWFHLTTMGTDSAGLYVGQDEGQFHGFPFAGLVAHPEWLILLGATVVAVLYVAFRSRDRAGKDAIALAGMSVVGIALTAQAMRTREYSVPVAFALLAVLAPRARESLRVVALGGPLVAVAMVLHGQDTLPLLETHLPTDEYRGARAILEANGDHPVLNIAEADYSMLRWEYDEVVCVQGQSRYFIYPYPALFHDVWELHDRPETSPETMAILQRFYDRGVRLVAVHRTHRMVRFAEAHPEVLRVVFVSKVNGATIYELAPEG
jgi:hypothetical protein